MMIQRRAGPTAPIYEYNTQGDHARPYCVRITGDTVEIYRNLDGGKPGGGKYLIERITKFEGHWAGDRGCAVLIKLHSRLYYHVARTLRKMPWNPDDDGGEIETYAARPLGNFSSHCFAFTKSHMYLPSHFNRVVKIQRTPWLEPAELANITTSIVTQMYYGKVRWEEI